MAFGRLIAIAWLAFSGAPTPSQYYGPPPPPPYGGYQGYPREPRGAPYAPWCIEHGYCQDPYEELDRRWDEGPGGRGYRMPPPPPRPRFGDW
jgi:hypothetical protein